MDFSICRICRRYFDRITLARWRSIPFVNFSETRCQHEPASPATLACVDIQVIALLSGSHGSRRASSRPWSFGRPGRSARSLTPGGSSPLVFIAPRLSPCGTQGQISPIGCRKPACSRCLWVPSSLQALVDECGSVSIVPCFPVWRGARHTPHFAPGVNCPDRREERQVPVGHHKCGTESKFMFDSMTPWSQMARPSDIPTGVGCDYRADFGNEHLACGDEVVACFYGLRR